MSKFAPLASEGKYLDDFTLRYAKDKSKHTVLQAELATT
jgi:hypothetical protein